MGAGRPAVAGGRARPELHFGHRRAAAMGRVGQPPTPPLNVLGDYAGGSLYLAFGLLAGILEARGSGRGQVVDAAMVDGVASIMTVTMGLHAAGMLDKARGTNLLDTGAPFYEVYACADGKYVSVGPIEESSTGCCSNSSGCRTIRSCRRRWTARNGLQRSRYSPRNSASARATVGTAAQPSRRLRGARARLRRSAEPSAREGARHVRRTGRRHASGARPTLFAHARCAAGPRCADHRQRDRRAATGCPTRASRRCARSRLSSDAGQQRHALTPAHCSLQLSACARRASKRRRGNRI